jgi:hypothetical protein
MPELLLASSGPSQVPYPAEAKKADDSDSSPISVIGACSQNWAPPLETCEQTPIETHNCKSNREAVMVALKLGDWL